MMTCDYILALNLAKEGKWDESHRLVQSFSDQFACQIHGYLHRIEGDLSNAQYWYDRANAKMPDNSLEEELERLYLLVDDN